MRKLTRRRIHKILGAVAEGSSIASMMRAHGFTRRAFRQWQDTYGMPVVHHEPKAEQLEALRTWRQQTTSRRAWSSFVRAAREIEHSEIAPIDGPKMDRYEHVAIQSWVAPRAMLVCEKTIIVDAAERWIGKKPSVSFSRRLMLVTTPWLPSREAVDMVAGHARREKLPMAFFGDLDPQALHLFAAMRAGGREELLRSPRKKHPIVWIGLDSRWLDWVDRTSSKLLIRGTIDMRHVDREYWQIVQRLVPDVRAIIGSRASKFLDDGKKLEVDAVALTEHRAAFLKELARRLRH